MDNAEIASSFQIALENIENAFQAYDREEEDEIDCLLWRAFSEIEYISFLVSIETEGNELVERRRKRVSRIDVKASLTDAREILLGIMKLVDEDRLSTSVSDELENAKMSVFNAIRKSSARNRKKGNQ